MNFDKNTLIKTLTLVCVISAMIIAGKDFRKHRTFQEPVVLSDGVTSVKKLSDYYKPLANSVADCNVYFFDSGKPGGVIMMIGGTHPEEPASVLASQVFVEQAKVKEGKLIVVIHSNRSASTVTRPGEGYPQFYRIKSPWGESTFRMGDRWCNALDSWPDPEVYVHYPSGQMLAYMDIRNLNRAWPGRQNGLLAERICHAFMNLIKQENVDVFIDYHEAELEYPVINTIVSHEKGQEIAATVSMSLTGGELPQPIGMEFSPTTLHGLSHREVGDHSQAISLLFEAPEPFLDRVRGRTDENLLLSGKDPFVMNAGKKGLLYASIAEKGWSMEERVGRHCSTALEVISTWTDMHPEKPVKVESVPRYKDIVDNSLGAYFNNPADAPKDRVVFE